MMKAKVILTIILISGVVTFLMWFFFVSVYEVKYNVHEFNDSSEHYIIIESYPLSSMGYKALFKEISFDYEITEGKNIIEKINFVEQNKLKIIFHNYGTIKLKLNSSHNFRSSLITYHVKSKEEV